MDRTRAWMELGVETRKISMRTDSVMTVNRWAYLPLGVRLWSWAHCMLSVRIFLYFAITRTRFHITSLIFELFFISSTRLRLRLLFFLYSWRRKHFCCFIISHTYYTYMPVPILSVSLLLFSVVSCDIIQYFLCLFNFLFMIRILFQSFLSYFLFSCCFQLSQPHVKLV